ncbi:MAG TPA: PAS domain S-box protein [Flavitalea sp.]|nr:PAS domain S-box protein [Flavitalea sp.]
MNSTEYSIGVDDLLMLFETTPDLVCIADKIGYFKNFNPAVPQTLGYTREELLAEPISSHMHPEDREMTLNRRAMLLKGETMVNFQNRYITKKGEILWLEWTSVYLPEKELVFAIAKNITARKKMEQQVEHDFIKLKLQASQFKSNLERERKYVAAELHEDLAQLATAVRVDVDWINSNVNTTGESKKRIEHAIVTADLLVDTIRRISFSISPRMLDDLGLDATLEWYCEEFSSLNGIDCSFESKYDEALLSKEIRLDFFRICQEALAGVKDHATRAKISIHQLQNKVILCIEGFQAKKSVETGVISIQERVDSFEGKWIVEGNKIIVEYNVKK